MLKIQKTTIVSRLGFLSHTIGAIRAKDSKGEILLLKIDPRFCRVNKK